MALDGDQLDSLTFRLFTVDEVRRMSVVEIVTPNSFDMIDHPLKGGLYDLVMGPSGQQLDPCLTCKQTARHCPGHFGRIELPVAVVNPLFQKEAMAILRGVCKRCNKFAMKQRHKIIFKYQMRFLESGYEIEASTLSNLGLDDEGPNEENKDLLFEENVKTFIRENGIDLNRRIPKTKTSESMRSKFIDYYNRHCHAYQECPSCKGKLWRVVHFQDQFVVPDGQLGPEEKPLDNPPNGKKSVQPTVILPGKFKQILRNIWEEEAEMIEALYPILKHRPPELKYGTDLLFMEAILVPPPKTRPLAMVKGTTVEHPQNRLYKDILRNSIIVRQIMVAAKENSYDVLPEDSRLYIEGLKGGSFSQKLQNCWRDLQVSVDKLLSTDGKGQLGVAGLKQLIEKKEGTLRKHMMGKRVNYAARSVITPDPNLLIQEIGVPEFFAMKLTYPVRVNCFNVHELRKMVSNGPSVYPGATMIETGNGSVIKLASGDDKKSRREGAAKLLLKSIQSGETKIVHRHLLNGDILLLNRQPTLHRPSIMAHRARILKSEKTLRMHYSNCKSYNADFDGDEMNAHFPQSEIARSEAYNIVCVRDNYLVPKDGTPLGGLIQDHVISGVKLTLRGRFFSREDYYQLVYQGLSHCRGDIKLLPPAILKPKMLWSGKQIISTILINIIPKNKSLITLYSKAKIRSSAWQTHPKRPWKCGKEFADSNEMSESDVIIRNGQLLCGVLDKEHYGATPYGLTHCLYDLYGGSCSSKFLDSAGRLFTAYLQLSGFTLGIKDILINEAQDRERNKIVKKARKIGEIAAKNALDLDEVPPDLEERLEQAYYADKAKFRARLDQEYKKILDSFTNRINEACLPRGLVTRFPDNNLQLMVTSGAKGSAVNTMQISCLLGQIELEGKRPPLMISGKSLPCFKPFETAPKAGGYIDGRFMTGITPQDFFFHCMAGREGLIDTAVKTSRSGYLQRCLIKHLEGVTVCYDGTVRDHDGSVIQFAYGEDGLEVQKATFFRKDQMDFLYRNKNSILDDSVLQKMKDSTDINKIEKHKKQIKAWDDNWKRSCYNGFALFSAHIRDEIPKKYWTKFDKSTGRSKASAKIAKRWNELDEKSRDAYKSIRPDPVTSKFNRNRDFGVITERLENLIDEYLETKKKRHGKTIRNIINTKYMASLCQPGEAVGLLAAQSIGEPSTQMTLNTFHFAGRGEMNVTLGIPRLREILMTGTEDIKTPYMDIPLRKAAPEKMEKRGNKLRKKFQMVTLADVLEKIEVRERLVTNPKMLITYTMRFTFLPHKVYKKLFITTPKDILRYVEKDFLLSLSQYIRRVGKKYGDIIQESKGEKQLTKDKSEEDVDNKSVDLEPRKRSSDSVSSSEEELDDEDATAARQRERHEEGREYDEEEEEEEAESDAAEEVADEEAEGEKEAMTVNELLQMADRENFVLKTFPMIKSYKYDVAKEEWCEMVFGIPATLSHIDFSSILKEICGRSVIYQVANVKRAILYKNPDGNPALKTEGINLIELFKYNKLVEINKVYSNDIHEMARVYGIEAAVRVIVNELKQVFGVYGITVDPRHLLLIADFMTFHGTFNSFSRIGMETSASPLQQMSFESTVGFLKEAISWAKTDALTSPSARIMTGKLCGSGTGSFDLINEGLHTAKKLASELRVCPESDFE